MTKKDKNQLIEQYAKQAALGNNGGDWNIHYTEQQKQYWRTFISNLIKDIKKGL